jgi:hypothetical protein
MTNLLSLGIIIYPPHFYTNQFVLLLLLDEKNLYDGYLETEVDWIPAMRGVKLKDLPTFFRTINSNDTMFNYNKESVSNAMKSKGIILNTFEELESDVLDAMKIKFPNLYPIGPLSLLHKKNSSNSNNQLETP